MKSLTGFLHLLTTLLGCTVASVVPNKPFVIQDEASGLPPAKEQLSQFWYCQAPKLDREHYTHPEHAELLQVITAIRHGDRSPVTVIPFENTTWDCSFAEWIVPFPDRSVGLATNLKMTIPGDNPYKTALWNGDCSPGQLTEIGGEQHYELGKALAETYGDFLKGRMKVRTTNKWRTEQSADAVLTGINSKISLQTPVTIETVPLPIEVMVPNPVACPRVAQLWHDDHLQDDEWSAYLSRNKKLRKQLDHIMGTKEAWDSRHYRSFDRYFDVLAARTCHEKPLPCAPGAHQHSKSTPACVTQEMAEQVFENGQWETRRLFSESPFAKELVRISIGHWLREMLNLMLAHSSSSTDSEKTGDPVKFVLYSGHDTSVAPLLGALGAKGRQMGWPPYASNVVMELWRKQGEDDLFVRVFYNGEILQTEWCDMRACQLEKFKERIGEFIPVNPLAECRLQ